MRTVVVYDSQFGNTARIAEAIGRGAGTHGPVEVLGAAEAASALTAPPDLLLVGGPTQRRGMTAGLRAFLDALESRRLSEVAVAAFDTRYRMATLLSGSAAKEAAGRLGRSGARAVVAPESFFMSRSGKLEVQVLEDGELERAETWGRRVAAGVAGVRAS